jgi:glutamyl-tRNA reductase
MTSDRMTVLVLGVDYRVAGAKAREALTEAAGAFHAWLASSGSPAIAGGFVVSTCHRVEFYVAVSDAERALEGLRAFAARMTGSDLLGEPIGVVRAGRTAVEHLCRVASGLESMVLGEHEISGQVRRAVLEARAAGVLSAVLGPVAAAALTASGRVRSETALGRGSRSLAGVAVQWLGREGVLTDARILIVGAGVVACEAAARIARCPIRQMTVASRSRAHADQLAARCGASAADLDAVVGHAARADVCVTAIRASGWRIDAAALSAARADRQRPLVVVDLSLPRACDPAIADLPNVRVVTIDDLGTAAAAVEASRRAAVPRAEAIVAAETDRAWRRLAGSRCRAAGAAVA